jgi:hypothetical protein
MDMMKYRYGGCVKPLSGWAMKGCGMMAERAYLEE